MADKFENTNDTDLGYLLPGFTIREKQQMNRLDAEIMVIMNELGISEMQALDIIAMGETEPVEASGIREADFIKSLWSCYG